MPTLTLKFKENTVQEYQLTKGQSFTIGRLEENDVPIENIAVYGHPAKIYSCLISLSRQTVVQIR